MLKYNCQKQPSCNSHYTNNLEINLKNLKKILFVLSYLIIQMVLNLGYPPSTSSFYASIMFASFIRQK